MQLRRSAGLHHRASPAYPPGRSRFANREFFIVTDLTLGLGEVAHDDLA
ncbi:hypothetical protein [Tepidamorphus gemmatus]|nr:hypothetical protein [Tepidamorphus gemmatus]